MESTFSSLQGKRVVVVLFVAGDMSIMRPMIWPIPKVSVVHRTDVVGPFVGHSHPPLIAGPWGGEPEAAAVVEVLTTVVGVLKQVLVVLVVAK